MQETLGFLGMGVMGAPMTRNLLRAGYPVVVYNRTAAKAQALSADGAQIADTPAEVCRRAGVVLACLFDGAAVEAVVTGPHGLLEGKADKLLRGDFSLGAEVNVHLKDLTYIRGAMDALGISLPLSELVRELFQQAVDAGLGREDHTAIVRLFERSAGVEARR